MLQAVLLIFLNYRTRKFSITSFLEVCYQDFSLKSIYDNFIFRKFCVRKRMIIYWDKNTNSKNRIGKRVKELRIAKKLSQKALAEQLQLAGYEFNDLTVLRIEQGIRFVPDYEVVALAEYFQVSCDYLLGITEK